MTTMLRCLRTSCARARAACGLAAAFVLATGCALDEEEWIDDETSGEELLPSCTMELPAEEGVEPRVDCFDTPEELADFDRLQPQVGLVRLARLYQFHHFGGARFDINQYGTGCPGRNIPALSVYGWTNRASGVSVNGFCGVDLFRYDNYRTRITRLDGSDWEWDLVYELTGSADNATSSLRVFNGL